MSNIKAKLVADGSSQKTRIGPSEETTVIAGTASMEEFMERADELMDELTEYV